MVWFDTIKVELILHRLFKDETKPRIQYGVGVLYDEFHGRAGTLPSKTTNSIPSWLISNEGIRMLNKLGYDLCHNCSGDGWDADCGGLFICPECKGRGVTYLHNGNIQEEAKRLWWLPRLLSGLGWMR